MENKVYQMVTDKIVELMQKGIIPWHKPWHMAGSAEEVAINYVTRRPYSLVNQWLLMEPGEYLTYKQIAALGGKVKKGAKSKFVVFFTNVEYTKKNEKTGEDEVKSYPLLRYYNVFHISNTEGIVSKIAKQDGEISATVPMCDEADRPSKRMLRASPACFSSTTSPATGRIIQAPKIR